LKETDIMKAGVVVLALTAAVNAHAAQPMFPMHVGDSWEYQADVEWTANGTSEVKHATVPWKMTVVDVEKGPGVQAVVVSGFLRHLALYDPSEPAKPTFGVLVVRKDGLWIDDSNPEDEDRAHAIALKAARGVAVGPQLLRFPLRADTCIADDPDFSKRNSPMYCWYLGAPAFMANLRFWEVAYRTNGDHEILGFTPAIGFTEYTYGHHGTVASAHAVLTEHTLAKPKK
jgi:hypothetical protein